MCPRVCPRSPPYTGGTQLFLLNNGHLRRLSDTFHWFFSRRAASRSRLQLFQPLIQESQFGRVLDGPALEVPPDDQVGGFQPVHVLEDESPLLLRQEENVVGDRLMMEW